MATNIPNYSRFLANSKSDSIVLENEQLPNRDQGSDGDIAVGQIKGQVYMFAKFKGKWYSDKMVPINSLGLAPDHDSGWINIFAEDENDLWRIKHNLGTYMIQTHAFLKITEKSDSGTNDVGNVIYLNSHNYSHTTYSSGVYILGTSPNEITVATGNTNLAEYDNLYRSAQTHQDPKIGKLRVLIWKINVTA